MKRTLIVLCLLALSALPAWGADSDTLAPPHVTYIRALDYSEYAADLGWCIQVKWQAVSGAEAYAIKVIGKKGLAPRNADDSPPKQAEWRTTTHYSTHADDSNQVKVCNLAQKQKVKFRLRTVDLDKPLDAYGTASAAFALRLQKYGKAPVLAYSGVPTIEVFG